jgi:hypothetical protein
MNSPLLDPGLHADQSEEAGRLITLRCINHGHHAPCELDVGQRVGPGKDRVVVIVGLLTLVVELEEAVGDGPVSPSIWRGPPGGASKATMWVGA